MWSLFNESMLETIVFHFFIHSSEAIQCLALCSSVLIKAEREKSMHTSIEEEEALLSLQQVLLIF